MKVTGARQTRFLSQPPHDLLGALLFGPDRGLVKARAAALIQTLAPDIDPAFGATVLTADDLATDPARLQDEMSAMSLLGGTRLVRLRLDHERSGAAIAKILKALDADPSRVEARLVIEAGDLSTRSAVRKAAEAAKHVAAIGCYPMGARDRRQQIKDRLDDLGIGVTPDALDLWIPLLEGDHALAEGEVEKMALYKGYGTEEGARVTPADVRALAAGAQGSAIDPIIQDALSGRLDSLDARYRRAVEAKTSPVAIHFALQRHILRLCEASARMDRGDSAQAATRSLRPPVFRMAEDAFVATLNRWNGRALRSALSQCQTVERQLKSTGAPAEALTQRLLFGLARFAARRRAA
ncbi:DNA polymerase III subunit delta [uncultured Algimonas sp.]|uniref:DNA polymerase III subunit delta n=1 Tax=uncultured Algimonas sp. TaxID=1547920 RepID=UPI002609AC89|nr:DNA polymerase III subunit delta [uncultured Algimonas sp.]